MASSKGTPTELQTLLKRLPVEEAVGKFAKHYWDNPGQAERIAEGIPELAYNRRTCKTIGIYRHSMGIGGTETVILALIDLWKKMGYRIVLLTDRPPQDDEYSIPDDVDRVILPDFNALNGDTYVVRARALAESLRTRDIDVLVDNQWMGRCLIWDMLVTKALGIGFIIYAHGNFSLLFRKWPLEIQQPIMSRIADAIICLNVMNAHFWSEFNNHSYALPNPLTHDLASFEKSNLNNNDIVWIGRFDLVKHPEDVITIMSKVTTRIPTARALLVGPICEPERDAYTRKIEQKGLSENIVLCGAHEDVRSFYPRSSLFLMTSESEGYPMALFEAKASGLPTVMYTLPYLTMAAENTGVLSVPQRDTAAAADCIISLLEDQELRRKLSQEALQDAESEASFDLETAWKQIFNGLGNTPTEQNEITKAMWDSLIEATRSFMQTELEDDLNSKDQDGIKPHSKNPKRGLRRRIRRHIHK